MSDVPEDRIMTLADRSVPRFEVYFAHDKVSATPGASKEPMDMDAALALETARIKGRVVQVASGAASPNQLLQLAGPWGGKSGQPTNDVLSVQFTDSIDDGRLATVTIELHNVYDFQSGRYRYTDLTVGQGSSPLIDYGITIALAFGYRTVEPVFEGIATKLDVSFPADGDSRLTITATDKRDRLRSQKSLKPKRFVDQSEEEIAAAVAAQMGLTVAVRSGQKTMPNGPVQMPADQDALQFITDRARKASLEMSCFGSTIFMLTPGDAGKTALAYTYRRGLTSFHPHLDGNGKPTSVTVVSRDPRSQKTYTGQATTQDLQQAGLIPSGTNVTDTFESKSGKREEIVTNYLAKSDDEAKHIARGILKRNQDKAFTAEGTLIGDPAVRAGRTLLIGGVGLYSGSYYVTESTHRFGAGGYQTSFQARRNAALGAGGKGT